MNDITPSYDRVKALHWCPRCQGNKMIGQLACTSGIQRIKRAYGEGYNPLNRVVVWLDDFLFNNNEKVAKEHLKEFHQ